MPNCQPLPLFFYAAIVVLPEATASPICTSITFKYRNSISLQPRALPQLSGHVIREAASGKPEGHEPAIIVFIPSFDVSRVLRVSKPHPTGAENHLSFGYRCYAFHFPVLF
ncbi:hypothetical protein HYDPIDRAFT_110023 [Hydnomerulius pinastri MD-312]|nr:hypothetical protein HYDPIDRAFT_110023 [Hydnomerulius pinastri MD-312]